MAHLAGVLLGAAGAFVGTNIDDFAVLLLLVLGQPIDRMRGWQLVAGQYLGFAGLLVISGLGAAGLHTVPVRWVGLLALVPLGMGAWAIASNVRARNVRARNFTAPPGDANSAPLLVSGVLGVAALTVANGGDNVAVYILLFRQSGAADLVVTGLVFLVLLGVWCVAALLIGHRTRRLVFRMVRINRWVNPAVFVLIGVILLLRTGVLNF